LARICELAGLLDDNYGLRGALLISDIQVALQLNLTVNNTGGLAPSLSFPDNPVSFGIGDTLSNRESRTFTEKVSVQAVMCGPAGCIAIITLSLLN
jgi:hypothetical protein